MDGGSEDFGGDGENAREVFVVDAFGLEVGEEGLDGIGGGVAEVRVEGEGAAGVDAHDFEAEDLFLDVGREVREGEVRERKGEVRMGEGFGGVEG